MDYEKIWGIPVIKLENGIDLEQIEFTGYNKSKESITLIGVANISKWHGYERIIKGMYDYYNSMPTKNVILNLIGNGQELENLKILVNKYNLKEKVIFQGVKSGKELSYLFKSAHVAVGSLGMYRIGINNGSTLKAKEYAARGIPYLF